jgi:predicted O-linked N-acetylglucosamine transferase (SPINDLY family)
MPPAEQVPCRRLGRGPITFGSFNSAGKISPRCGRAWAKVLASVPFSRLVIKGQGLSDRGTRDTALRALVRHGIEPARVDLRGLCASYSEHLAMHNQIDVMLDPFPYNGVTTTCEALWMGVPVVTLEGTREGGRIGASIMRAVGLEANIACDEATYVARAAALAAEMKNAPMMRDDLRAKVLASPLCDSASFARRFTDAIETLAERCVFEGL